MKTTTNQSLIKDLKGTPLTITADMLNGDARVMTYEFVQQIDIFYFEELRQEYEKKVQRRMQKLAKDLYNVPAKDVTVRFN